MTVAIGLVCKDGVLVASDSMATTTQQTAVQTVKVNAFANNPVVWTSAGSVYVKEEIEAVITSKLDDMARDLFSEPKTLLLRGELKSKILPAMKKCYEGALSTSPFPPGSTSPFLISDFLFLGYANSTPWFLEIDQTGSVNWHTQPGFYAIGSGGPFASVCHALMKHYLVEDLTLEQGKQLAYRAIETTCDASAGGVGTPVQIAIVDDAGARVLTSDEVAKVGTAVTRWKELERDTLQMGVSDEVVDIANEQPEALPSIEET